MSQLLDWIEMKMKIVEEVPEPKKVEMVIQPEQEEPQLEEVQPKLDPTVERLVEQMALVMQSISQLTDAIAGDLKVPAMAKKAETPKIQTPREPKLDKSLEGTERKYTPRGNSYGVINQAIDAIIAYNNAPERLQDEKWAISINVLKSFANAQSVIQQVLEQRNDEIATHHQQHDIEVTKQNLKHRGKQKNIDVIKI